MKRTTTLLALLALQACSNTEAPSAETGHNAAATPPAAASAAEPRRTPAAPVEEAAILAEKEAQWASSAEASTSFNDASGGAGYAPSRATGEPDVPRYADHPNAWASRNGDANVPDWLQVSFAKPVYARSLRIRQSAAPGAISKIELLDESGAAHLVWEGTDTTSYAKDTIGWMIRDFDLTSYKVAGARITLETKRVWGWNEIDAVQLVGVERLETQTAQAAQVD
jgi:hypothetical protein